MKWKATRNRKLLLNQYQLSCNYSLQPPSTPRILGAKSPLLLVPSCTIIRYTQIIVGETRKFLSRPRPLFSSKSSSSWVNPFTLDFWLGQALIFHSKQLNYKRAYSHHIPTIPFYLHILPVKSLIKNATQPNPNPKPSKVFQISAELISQRPIARRVFFFTNTSWRTMGFMVAKKWKWLVARKCPVPILQGQNVKTW